MCKQAACTNHLVPQPRPARKAQADADERVWYARQTVRARLEPQRARPPDREPASTRARARPLTNFDRTLPAPAVRPRPRRLLKDPYNFDFLTLGDDAHERDLERGLLDHLREFLLELGVGFAFVGSQYHLEVGGEDFYIDLLFYHLKLRCFVVIELKIGAVRAGVRRQDELLPVGRRRPAPPPGRPASIGLILCKAKNSVVVEYALRDTAKPIGVAGYTAGKSLPADLRDELPSPERLEEELAMLPV